MVAARTRHGKFWQRPYFRLTAKTGLLHRSKRRAQVGSLFDHLVGGRERCGISIPPMSLVGSFTSFLLSRHVQFAPRADIRPMPAFMRTRLAARRPPPHHRAAAARAFS